MSRIGSLVLVHAILMQSVVKTAASKIMRRQAEIVTASKPIKEYVAIAAGDSHT